MRVEIGKHISRAHVRSGQENTEAESKCHLTQFGASQKVFRYKATLRMGLEENKGSCSSSDKQRPRDVNEHQIQGEYVYSLGGSGWKKNLQNHLGIIGH